MATKKAIAPVVKDNAANVEKTTTTNNATNNNNNAAAIDKLSPVAVVELSATWIKQYGTISAIRADYAALVEKYGKDNFSAVLTNCKTIRAAEIENAAAVLAKDVFSYDGILNAVFASVARSKGYADLCKYAKKVYDTTDNAAAAKNVIRDFFANVDENGAPLCKVMHISATGAEIYTVYDFKKVTDLNAVSILKQSLKGMKNAATNAATRKNGNDNAAATRANVRAVGKVIAVYAAATDANGRAQTGERRDTSKDERTKNAAAAILGNSLPVGCVPLSTWNAAANGNEEAAAIVEDAKNAAKDAAAARIA